MNKSKFPPILIPQKEMIDQKLEFTLEIEPDNGLVIPNVSKLTHLTASIEKIMPSLFNVREAVEKAKEQGKHVLVLPGSFDLVHKGHAFYVKQSVDCYCMEAGCKREDLFVVMLADDDELIKQVKSFKHKDFGGDEPQLRPVEKAAERALSMANIPEVDIVGIIPAPSSLRSSLPTPPHYDIQKMLDDLKNNFEKFEKERISHSGDVFNKTEIDAKIKKDREELEAGVLAYKKMEIGWNKKKDIGKVPVQAWQLYVLGVVAGVSSGNGEDPGRFQSSAVTRLVNTEDTKYLGQVLFLMRYANIGIALLKYKIPGSSTTELIKWAIEEHGRRLSLVPEPWDIIREYKRNVIGEHRISDYHKAINLVESKFKKTYLDERS
jgi:hypothetical protein